MSYDIRVELVSSWAWTHKGCVGPWPCLLLLVTPQVNDDIFLNLDFPTSKMGVLIKGDPMGVPSHRTRGD